MSALFRFRGSRHRSPRKTPPHPRLVLVCFQCKFVLKSGEVSASGCRTETQDFDCVCAFDRNGETLATQTRASFRHPFVVGFQEEVKVSETRQIVQQIRHSRAEVSSTAFLVIIRRTVFRLCSRSGWVRTRTK